MINKDLVFDLVVKMKEQNKIYYYKGDQDG